MESNIRKTCGEKHLNFFEPIGKFPYFDMLKNGNRGSNRLVVRKSFETQIVRVPKQIPENLNNIVVEILIKTDLLYDAVRFSVGLTNKRRLFCHVFITCGAVHFG